MGQFSVEICHLVGQFSMKLNIPALLRSNRARIQYCWLMTAE